MVFLKYYISTLLFNTSRQLIQREGKIPKIGVLSRINLEIRNSGSLSNILYNPLLNPFCSKSFSSNS